MIPYIVIIAASSVVALLFLSWTGARHPATNAYIRQAIQGLPSAYQDMALHEMDVTRRIGRTVTRNEADKIIDLVRKVAREHGVMTTGG